MKIIEPKYNVDIADKYSKEYTKIFYISFPEKADYVSLDTIVSLNQCYRSYEEMKKINSLKEKEYAADFKGGRLFIADNESGDNVKVFKFEMFLRKIYNDDEEIIDFSILDDELDEFASKHELQCTQ